MKKKIFLRSILGFPLGLAIGYVISIIVSLINSNGDYTPCEPTLIAMMGNEINAVMLQALLCGILGMGFAASSVIWELENWGIIKQTGIYFLIFGIFVLIFVIIWIIQYTIIRRHVKKMNEALKAVQK